MMTTMTTIAPTISRVPEDDEVEEELKEEELEVDTVVGTDVLLLELLLPGELEAAMELDEDELELLEALSGRARNHA